MPTLLSTVMERNAHRYRLNILWRLRRYGHDMDLTRGLDAKDACKEILAQAYLELAADIRDRPVLSEEQMHLLIRRKLSAIVSRDAQKTPNRRRLRVTRTDPDRCAAFKKNGNDNILEFPSPDALIVNDFLRFVECVEPALACYARSVIGNGHARPADLAEAFGMERTDADYVLRRLRRRLRDYLSDADPPFHRTSS